MTENLDMMESVKYDDIEKLSEAQLEYFLDNPLGLIANCDLKLKFGQMDEATITALYPDIPETQAELPEPNGYRLDVVLKDGTALTARREVSPDATLLEKVQVQYKLAEDIMNQIESHPGLGDY